MVLVGVINIGGKNLELVLLIKIKIIISRYFKWLKF